MSTTSNLKSGIKAFKVLPERKGIEPKTDAPTPENLRPNFLFHWGDGPNDRIETDDAEIMVITASNPYSNVVLKNVHITLIKLTKDGKKVPSGADGSPSVEITPSKVIWFGDLAPADREKRDVVLMSCAALQGEYKIAINYDFQVCYDLKDCDHYLIDLVRS